MIPDYFREELLAELDTAIWNEYVQPNHEAPVDSSKTEEAINKMLEKV